MNAIVNAGSGSNSIIGIQGNGSHHQVTIIVNSLLEYRIILISIVLIFTIAFIWTYSNDKKDIISTQKTEPTPSPSPRHISNSLNGKEYGDAFAPFYVKTKFFEEIKEML